MPSFFLWMVLVYQARLRRWIIACVYGCDVIIKEEVDRLLAKRAHLLGGRLFKWRLTRTKCKLVGGVI